MPFLKAFPSICDPAGDHCRRTPYGKKVQSSESLLPPHHFLHAEVFSVEMVQSMKLSYSSLPTFPSSATVSALKILVAPYIMTRNQRMSNSDAGVSVSIPQSSNWAKTFILNPGRGVFSSKQ